MKIPCLFLRRLFCLEEVQKKKKKKKILCYTVLSCLKLFRLHVDPLSLSLSLSCPRSFPSTSIPNQDGKLYTNSVSKSGGQRRTRGSDPTNLYTQFWSDVVVIDWTSRHMHNPQFPFVILFFWLGKKVTVVPFRALIKPAVSPL